jgi:hypothetical protein
MALFAKNLEGFPYLGVSLLKSPGPLWKIGLHIKPPWMSFSAGQAYYDLLAGQDGRILETRHDRQEAAIELQAKLRCDKSHSGFF